MLEQGFEPGLPEVSKCFEHLVDWLFDAGPEIPTGMGAMPLGDVELRAWQENSGYGAEPWEVRVLKSLSAEWIAEKDRAEDPKCPPPYQVALPTREEVARKIDELL